MGVVSEARAGFALAALVAVAALVVDAARFLGLGA